METNKKQELVMIKKGLFYYVFFVLSLPFKALFWIFKNAWKYLSIYLGWAKEYTIWNKKQKSLNKWLTKNKLREEIL